MAPSPQNAEIEFNFGAKPFRFGPPPGFVGLDQAPETIKAADRGDAGSAKDGAKKPLALILEPTRDLAEQVRKRGRRRKVKALTGFGVAGSHKLFILERPWTWVEC